MRGLVAILARRRRAVLIALGLAVALLCLAAPLAHADIWANVGPGRSLAGLKGGWTLGAYELDENFSMISAGVFSGVDVSGFLPMIAFFFANEIWLVTSWFANLLIELFGFAFSLDLVNGSGATGAAGALGPVSRAIQSIYTTAFGRPWMVLAVSGAALWAMWKALVQRRYAETASQLSLSLIYVCVAFFFVLQPGQTIGTASHWTNEMSGAFLSIAKDGEPTSPAEAKEAGADQLFGLLVAQPWAVLEFGGLEHCVKSGSEEGDEPESVPVEPIAPSAARGLESGQIVTSGGKTCINNLKKYGPHLLRMPAGSKERKQEVEALEDGDTSELPDSDPGKGNGSYELGPRDKPAAAAMEKGGQYQRLLVGFVILLAELGAFLLLGGLSLGVIVAQVELLLLLAFSPVALVAAVVPGRGHQFFKGWLAKLAGLLLRKAAYSLILAILLAVCAAISAATAQLGWLFSFGLQCAFFWTVFLRRRALTDGLVGVVTGPDASGRDRALSLLALYAGARVGSRTLVQPAARVGRGAGRGLAWAGSTFLGRGRGRDGGSEPVAPVRGPGVPLGGKQVHAELGGRGDARRRGGHEQGARRRRSERRPGDRARDAGQDRRRPVDRHEPRERDSEARRTEEKAERPARRVPRGRRTGRAGWWRGAGRRGGRSTSAGSKGAATVGAASAERTRRDPVSRSPRPTPAPGATRHDRPASDARPRATSREPRSPDLGDALRDDQRRRRDVRSAKPSPQGAESGGPKRPGPDGGKGDWR
ncbi:MAG: hypothetical protein ACRDPE_13995 [Solirubrobacterales bacterium]